MANGGVGGDAFENSIANYIVIENYGTIRSGGGGGGLGGVGGAGSYSTTVTEGPIGHWGSATHVTKYWHGTTGTWGWQWAGSWLNAHNNPNPYNHGGWTYTNGAQVGGTNNFTQYQIKRSKNVTTYTTGGIGGPGGRGLGYNGVDASGSAGTNGGTNAGIGGAGGGGGSWGLSGSDGSVGIDGNNGSGASGSPGGLAGFAYKGQFSVTNLGTILGRI